MYVLRSPFPTDVAFRAFLNSIVNRLCSAPFNCGVTLFFLWTLFFFVVLAHVRMQKVQVVSLWSVLCVSARPVNALTVRITVCGCDACWDILVFFANTFQRLMYSILSLIRGGHSIGGGSFAQAFVVAGELAVTDIFFIIGYWSRVVVLSLGSRTLMLKRRSSKDLEGFHHFFTSLKNI